MNRRSRATYWLSTGLLLAFPLPHPGSAPDRARTAPAEPLAVAVLAGGCYWGMESVFEHVRGVDSVVAGFATPAGAAEPGAELPARHRGIAEAVKVFYDPAEISYGQLLQVYFTVAHDPTQVDRQGPDVGTRYRSAIFVQGEEQYQAALRYLEQLRQSATPGRLVVTELVTLREFRAASADQQDFARKHPDMPYIRINDVPKIRELRERFPAVYRDE
ncbi:MAG: peptide-methionine (S)-S-oxide reductase MsrA [Gemmatimonadales bacterium]